MKILKGIFIVLLVLVVLLLGIAFLLPSKYHVERSIVIQTPPEKIYPLVNTLKRWEEWTPWTTAKDPTLAYTYEGPEQGVGAISKWNGKTFGTGSLKVTKSDPKTGIEWDLDFNNGEMTSKGAMKFEAAGAETKVIWRDDGDLGNNPISRYFGLMMDSFLAPYFEEGLNNLKAKSEAAPADEPKK